MIVMVNGTRREVAEEATVAKLIEELSASPRGVAVAIDGEVVPRAQWAATPVPDGARVEVVAAIQGG
jgi:sulfur carrier protein